MAAAKYLTKSRIAAAIAILYLFFVSVLIATAVSGGVGLHGTGSMAFFFAFLFTLPLSQFALTDGPDSRTHELISAGIVAICAVVNSAVIYLSVWTAGWSLGTLVHRLK